MCKTRLIVLVALIWAEFVWIVEDAYPYILAGRVEGIVDIPDYCSASDTLALGQVELEVGGSTYHATSLGTFSIFVPSPDPVEVKAFLRSGDPNPFTVTLLGVAEAEVLCTPGVDCVILFNDGNSDQSERTTYYWVRSAMDEIGAVQGCPTTSVTIELDAGACQGSYGSSRIQVGRQEFPCGAGGRIASVFLHELGHWLDCPACPSQLADTDGQQGLADGLAVFLLTHPSRAHTGNGLYLNKCGYGIRQHSVFRRLPEDVFGGLLSPFNSEILSGFYWDVSQDTRIPRADALRFYLTSVCHTSHQVYVNQMQEVVDAYCQAADGQYNDYLKAHARAHGFTWPELGCRSTPADEAYRPPMPPVSSPGRTNRAMTLSWRIHPNPASPRTVISVESQSRAHVALVVYDSAGREVVRVFEGFLPAGNTTYHWDGKDKVGRDVPAGVYFARLSTDHGDYAQRILVLK